MPNQQVGVQLNWNGNAALQAVVNACNGNLRDMAENMTDIAKTDHPYQNQTGTNTRSITWDEQNGVFRVYTTSGYGGYLELGTSKMQPYPYIQPAFDKSKQELEQKLGRVV